MNLSINASMDRSSLYFSKIFFFNLREFIYYLSCESTRKSNITDLHKVCSSSKLDLSYQTQSVRNELVFLSN